VPVWPCCGAASYELLCHFLWAAIPAGREKYNDAASAIDHRINAKNIISSML
jgi:hypothetical protein